jgi:glycosyltransferase involved in cell wall biosynthesis
MTERTLPLISVIIRSYNREDSIVKALMSVLNQSYTNIEVLVVNDGSTDKTLDKLLSLDNHKIKINSHRDNLGLVAALNTGFQMVNEDAFAISFLDSDDIWSPEHLSVLFTKLTSNEKLGFVYSQTLGRRLVTIEGCNKYGEILKNKALVPLCALLVRKELATAVFPIVSKVNMCEDDRLCYELSKLSCFSYVVDATFIPIGAKNSVTRNRKQLAEGWGSLLEDYSQDILRFAGSDVLINRRIDQLFLWLFAGEFNKTRKEIVQILKIENKPVVLFFRLLSRIAPFIKSLVVFVINYFFPNFVNFLRKKLRNQ